MKHICEYIPNCQKCLHNEFPTHAIAVCPYELGMHPVEIAVLCDSYSPQQSELDLVQS